MPVRLVLAFDAEPDPRWIGDPGDDHFRGIRASFEFVRRLRDAISPLQQVPPAFTWLVRADEQVARGWDDRAFVLDRFARELAGLAAEGDDVGLHTHLYRPMPDGWAIDNESPAWRRDLVAAGAAAFFGAMGRRARVHSFGDRAFFPDVLGALDEAGIDLDLTVESGMGWRPAFVVGERLLGSAPDHSKAPLELWRPSPDDWTRDDPRSPWRVRLMPVATWRLPWWLEPGRRVDVTRRRLLGEAASMDELTQRWVRLCLSHRAYVVRAGCAQVRRERRPRMLHFVLRTNQLLRPEVARRVLRNVETIASGALGGDVEFVSATGLLAAVDREAAAAASGPVRAEAAA